MKVLLPLLMLTVTASYYPQDTKRGVDVVQEIMSARSAPKWRKKFAIRSDSTPPPAIGSKEAFIDHETIIIEVYRPGDIEGLKNTIANALAPFKHQIELEIRRIGIEVYARDTGEYRATPVRVTSYCINGFCTATASGGRVIKKVDRSLSPAVVERVQWQNYP